MTGPATSSSGPGLTSLVRVPRWGKWMPLESFLGLFLKSSSVGDVAVPWHTPSAGSDPAASGQSHAGEGRARLCLPSGGRASSPCSSAVQPEAQLDFPPASSPRPPVLRAPSALHVPRSFLKLALPTRGQISEPEPVELFI